YYELKPGGDRKLKQLEIANYKLPRPKRWDRKWRIVIFDINEKKRKLRDQIRNLLVSLGFIRLQNSVWVYPYDCEDIIWLIKSNVGVGKDILYLIVDEIENDKHLLKSFGLL